MKLLITLLTLTLLNTNYNYTATAQTDKDKTTARANYTTTTALVDKEEITETTTDGKDEAGDQANYTTTTAQIDEEEITTTAQIDEEEITTKATAAQTTIDVGIVTVGGTGFTYGSNTVTITANGNYILTGNTNSKQIKVNSGLQNVNITLNNLNVDRSATANACALDCTGATVNLTVNSNSNNSLKSGENKAGIQVPKGATIFIDGTGNLTTTGGNHAAGIGGGLSGGCGNITINGGNVTALSGSFHAAGIGGGMYGGGGNITISNGNVTATGYTNGAGIGDGVYSDSGNECNITISGGTVTANGEETGIGRGSNCLGGIVNININGGNVTANGGITGAGIGEGSNSGGIVNINFSGGNVTANGGNCGAGIGEGSNSDGIVNINFSGSNVTANGGNGGAGIGTGSNSKGTVNINFSRGNITANGGDSGGAGIGTGSSSTSACHVTISGGTIIATKGSWASSDAQDIEGNALTITGGSIHPTNGSVVPTPTNGTETLYLNTLTVGSNANANTTINAAKIDGLFHYENGAYGINDVKTDANGKIFLWLPQQNIPYTLNVTANNTNYSNAFDRPANAHDKILSENYNGLSLNGDSTLTFYADQNVTDQYTTLQIKNNNTTATGNIQLSFTQNPNNALHLNNNNNVSSIQPNQYENVNVYANNNNLQTGTTYTAKLLVHSNTVADVVNVKLVVRLPQTISIEQGNSLNKTYGTDPFTLETQGGSGTGAISWNSTDQTVATVEQNGQVTILSAGTTNIIANKAADTIYSPTSVTVPLTVQKATITVTPRDTSKVYGDDDPTLPYSWTTLKNNDTPDDVFIGALSRTQGENANLYDILTEGLTVSNNYNPTFVTGAKLTITKAPLTVTTRDTTKVYGEVDPPLPYSWSNLKNNDTKEDVFTGALSRTQGENVDDYDILTDGLTVSNNYNPTFVTGAKLTINPAPLEITLRDTSKVYGEDDPALPYGWSNLKNNDTPDDVFIGALSRTQGQDADSYDILTDGLNVSDNYNTTFVTGAKLTITKAPLTITPRDTAKVYGDEDPALTYSWTTLKNNDKPEEVFTGTLTRTQGENVDSYDILTDQLNVSDNYDVHFNTGAKLTINKAPLEITLRDTAKVYGDEDPELPYGWSPLANNDSPEEVFTGTLSRTQGQDAGKYDILTDQLNVSDNYDVHFNTGAKLTITKAPLEITLRDTSKVYGEDDPALPYSWSDLKNSDTPEDVFTGALSREQGQDADSYDILTEGLNVSDNYNVNFVTGAKLTINPAPLEITLRDTSKVYGEEDPELTYEWSDLKNNDTPSQVFTGTLSREQGQDADSYDILTDGLTVSNNYDVNFVTGAKLTINKAPLNVTPKDTTKVYGDEDPQLTYHWTTLKNNDTPEEVFTGTLSRTQGHDAGEYDILTDQLNVSDNYDVSFNTGAKLTITKAPLTVTPQDTSKVYGSVDPVLTYHWSTLKNNDTPDKVFTGALTRTQGHNAGEYDILTEGLTVSNNYNTTFVTGAKLTITKTTLTVTALGANAVYLEPIPDLTLNYSGFVLGEDSTVLTTLPTATTAVTGDSVGTYTIKVEGATAKNYSINYKDGKLKINKRIPQASDLYISPDTAVYTGKTHKVTVDTAGVKGFGKISGVKYGESSIAPNTPGKYPITVNVTAGKNYSALNGLLVDTLVINKAPIDSVKLTVNNNDTPDKALVIPKNIIGLGTLTVKFDGNTEMPTAPGEYKVTVDHTNGDYYQDATDHEVGTYTIAGSDDPTNPDEEEEEEPTTDEEEEEEDPPLDNQNVKTTQGKVWTNGQLLFIQAQHNEQVRIYTLAGQLYTTLNVGAGEHKELTITQGFYVVVLDGKTHKVMVR